MAAIRQAVKARLHYGQAASLYPTAIVFQANAMHFAGGRGDLDIRVIGAEAAALDQQLIAIGAGTQVLFLQIRFLHQPMGDTAQQFRLRAAAFKTTSPQPGMIRQQLRHPAIANARGN